MYHSIPKIFQRIIMTKPTECYLFSLCLYLPILWGVWNMTEIKKACQSFFLILRRLVQYQVPWSNSNENAQLTRNRSAFVPLGSIITSFSTLELCLAWRLLLWVSVDLFGYKEQKKEVRHFARAPRVYGERYHRGISL